MVLAVTADAKMEALTRLAADYAMNGRMNVIRLHSTIQLAALIRHSVAVVCLEGIGTEAPIFQALPTQTRREHDKGCLGSPTIGLPKRCVVTIQSRGLRLGHHSGS